MKSLVLLICGFVLSVVIPTIVAVFMSHYAPTYEHVATLVALLLGLQTSRDLMVMATTQQQKERSRERVSPLGLMASYAVLTIILLIAA